MKFIFSLGCLIKDDFYTVKITTLKVFRVCFVQSRDAIWVILMCRSKETMSGSKMGKRMPIWGGERRGKKKKKNLDGEEKNLHKRVDVWSYWFLLKRPFLLLGREVSRWKSGKDSSLPFPSSLHAFLIISLIQHGNGCAHKKMARAAAEVGVWDLPVIGIIAPETQEKRCCCYLLVTDWEWELMSICMLLIAFIAPFLPLFWGRVCVLSLSVCACSLEIRVWRLPGGDWFTYLGGPWPILMGHRG